MLLVMRMQHRFDNGTAHIKVWIPVQQPASCPQGLTVQVYSYSVYKRKQKGIKDKKT